ncbi:hypothetical protein J1N35_044203 [Gossypium stocksii]|uniref:Uncharacterized protein n=1 Tax=Gossypium stocksii TaxID=47602 RepID=A0A9D3ZFK5_9ROSI|nr:hypothetical protein J1N35_044203 [Gossypium stocksii]
MAGYGGYTYSNSHTGASPRSYSGSKTINTTDQVADRWRKPIMSYTTNGNTDQYYVTNTEITIQQSCVYKYTQSSPINVVGVSRTARGARTPSLQGEFARTMERSRSQFVNTQGARRRETAWFGRQPKVKHMSSMLEVHSELEMAHPNENFSFNLPSGQARASGFDSQHSRADLFAGWFVDRPKNFGNAVYQGVSSPLDLNVPIDQGLPFPPNQEVPKDMFQRRRDLKIQDLQSNHEYTYEVHVSEVERGITYHKVWLACTSELTSLQRQRTLKEHRMAPSRGRIDSLGKEKDLVVKSLGILPKPSLRRSTARRLNLRDKCSFYDDVGHKTEDCFTMKDAIEEAIRNEGNNLMVVSATIAGFEVKRILVDSRSVVKKMGLKEHALSEANLFYGFVAHPVKVKGSTTLPVTLGDGEHTITEYVQFFFVDHPMAYNVIFRRSVMRKAKMVIATFCIKIKFSTRTRVRFL